jgi:hypothetical protein
MEDELLSRRAFADVIGKSHTWVADKIKDESITLQGGKIPKNRALEELKGLGLIGSGSKKEKNTGKFPPVLQSKAKFEFFKARKMEIEVARIEGEIVYKDDLQEKLTEFISLMFRGLSTSFFLAYDEYHPDSKSRDGMIDDYFENHESNEDMYNAFNIMAQLGVKHERIKNK